MFYIDCIDEVKRLTDLLTDAGKGAVAYDHDKEICHVMVGTKEGSGDLEYEAYDNPMHLVDALPLRASTPIKVEDTKELHFAAERAEAMARQQTDTMEEYGRAMFEPSAAVVPEGRADLHLVLDVAGLSGQQNRAGLIYQGRYRFQKYNRGVRHLALHFGGMFGIVAPYSIYVAGNKRAVGSFNV